MAAREWIVYESENYEVRRSDSKKCSSVDHFAAPPRKWFEKYMEEGLRKSVYGVLLSHHNGFPHLFVLRHLSTGSMRLMGGKIKFGEAEKDGLTRKLTKVIGKYQNVDKCRWHVGEMVCQFWRPEFDGNIYPYLPPHCCRPKQTIKVFQVVLPPRCVFEPPPGFEVRSVPLYEIYEDSLKCNSQNYGRLLAALPTLLARYVVYPMVQRPLKDLSAQVNKG